MPRLPKGRTARPLRRRTVTRELLLDAAERLIVDGGYASASVENICSEADYTRGAFYSNFVTRNDVLLGLFDRHAQPRLELLSEKFAACPEGLSRIAEEEKTWTVLFLEFRLQASRDSALAVKLAEHDQALESALAKVVEGFGWSPASMSAELARALLAAREGLLARMAASTSTPLRRDALNSALSALMPSKRPSKQFRQAADTIPLW